MFEVKLDEQKEEMKSELQRSLVHGRRSGVLAQEAEADKGRLKAQRDSAEQEKKRIKEQLEERDREQERNQQEMRDLQEQVRRLEQEKKKKSEDHEKAREVLSLLNHLLGT